MSDGTSRVSVVTGESNSEDIIDESRTSTCSPYFCSFTRTYEPKDTSDKSIQPTLKSVESEVSKEIFKARKLSKERSKDRRDRVLKSVRLNYSDESDNSEAALCLYANESSKCVIIDLNINRLAFVSTLNRSVSEEAVRRP